MTDAPILVETTRNCWGCGGKGKQPKYREDPCYICKGAKQMAEAHEAFPGSRTEDMLRLAEAVVDREAAREACRMDRGSGAKSEARFRADERYRAALAKICGRDGATDCTNIELTDRETHQ